VFLVICAISSATYTKDKLTCQWPIDDRKAATAHQVIHIGDSNTFCNCSAGTFIGPADGADPGAGWGKAVDIAVWNETLPSTFCMIW